MTRAYKISFIIVAILAVLVGFYPVMYFVIDRRFGLLASKTAALLANPGWNIAFYTHIIGGGIALLIGWSQFSAVFRDRYMSTHRLIGKIYVIMVMFSSVAGIVVSFFATGGLIAAMGFFILGVIWFSTTLGAYRTIRQGNIRRHQQLMIYSYACCFGAVTLRIWLPLLILSFGKFTPAYLVVAWISWVPNLLVAAWLVKRLPATSRQSFTRTIA